MDALKMLNLAVAFLLELCMLVAVGYWGFKTQSSWVLKILFGIGLPLQAPSPFLPAANPPWVGPT